MDAFQKYENDWKKNDNKYKNPRLFGLHWHNVFLILFTVLFATLTLLQTIKLATEKQVNSIDIAQTVAFGLTTFASVVLLVRFVQFNPLHLFVKNDKDNNYLNLGLYPDPIDIDTTDLSRALEFGKASITPGHPVRGGTEWMIQK